MMQLNNYVILLHASSPVPPEDLEVGYEKVYVRDDPTTYVYVKDVCYGYQYSNGHSIGGQVIGKGNYTMRHLTHLDTKTGKGKTGPEFTVGAQGVEIEFDTRDLTYKILDRKSTRLNSSHVSNS